MLQNENYNIVRQDIIVDSFCFRVVQVSHHKLKHVASLRNTLKSFGYTIRGFPVIYWQKATVQLVVDFDWVPTTNTNFLVYTHKNKNHKDFLEVLLLLTKAKSCVLLTKFDKRFLDTPRLKNRKIDIQTTTQPILNVLREVSVKKQELLPYNELLFSWLNPIETSRTF